MLSRPAFRRSTALNIDTLVAPAAMASVGAILVAFLVDHFLGEPPARLHPVVWMGKALSATGAPWEYAGPATAYVRGAGLWILGAAASAATAWAATAAIRRLSSSQSVAGILIQAVAVGVLLKPLLAWRMLHDEVANVERALESGLESGRAQLSRLVSRDTTHLSVAEVRESALESLAENLNDSLVAPLFWFSVAGLPGAALYRFANTADAMWGYRGRWEWAGKWSARADDVLSYIPARLTAALLAVAAWHSPARLSGIARITPSPNGGWPMGMLALALQVRLGKPGVYVLNSSAPAPSPLHFWRGLGICQRAARVSLVVTATMILVLASWR
jgi:adenosylcobinamide-phosphate synthase